METKFLKERNNSQFKTAERAICKFIVSRFFETLHSNGADPFAGYGFQSTRPCEARHKLAEQ